MSEVKRNLYGLTPATRYAIKVRAVNGFGVYSNWSEALVVTTSGDNSVPKAPTNLVLDFSSPNLVISWNAPLANVDNTPFLDFSYYEVTVLNAGVPKVFKTVDTPFVYSFGQNQIDWGTAVPRLDVEVRTVDFSGNKSEVIAGSATNTPPADPDAPTVIAAFTFITIIMDLNYSINDLKSYDLYYSTTTNDDDFDLLSSSPNGSFIHEVTDDTRYYYKFKVKDVFNQESDFSPIVSAAGLIEGSIDDVPPDDWDLQLNGTSGLDDVSQEPYITLNWLPQTTATDLDHYEIRHTISGENLFVTNFASSDLTSFTIKHLINETDYDFQMRAVDFSGNKGNWLPPTPTTLTTIAGSLKYDTTATGGLVVQGSSGFIRSSNYAAGTAGWRLNYQGLEINEGTISAPAIQIGISNENLLRNSSFENIPSTIATDWSAIGAGNTYSKETGAGNYLYQSASQKMVTAAVAQAGISQTISIANGFLRESIPANTWVTISIWIKQGSGSARNAKLSLTDNTNAVTYVIPTAVSTSTTYQRLVHKAYVTGASTSLTFKAWVDNPAASESFYFEGAQLQLASYATSYAPATLEIPDNYIQNAYISSLSADKFTSGTISAAQIDIASSGYIESVNYAASGTPAGYRLTSSSLVFQNGSISIVSHGGFLDLNSSHMYLGDTSGSIFKADSTGVTLSTSVQVTTSAIQSSNYTAGSTGWQIKNDGSAEYNNVTVRGNIQGNSSTIITGGTFRTGTSGARILATGDTGVDAQAPTFKLYNSAGANKLNLISTGIFIGGSDSTNSPFYYDITNSRAIFQNTGTYNFTISSNPSDSKVIKLVQAGSPFTEKFSLDTAGNALFSGQVTASSFSSSNVVGSGSGSTGDLLKSTNYVTATANTLVTADAAIGATSITVLSTTGFSSAGTLTIGTQIITYSSGGGSGTTFSGIPASGAGSITAAITASTPVSNGIGWRVDALGNTEFNNSVFRGTISAAQVVGNLTLNGGKFRTSASGKRIEIGGTGSTADDIYFYSGLAGATETFLANINVDTSGTGLDAHGNLHIYAPSFHATQVGPSIHLYGPNNYNGAADSPGITLSASNGAGIFMTGLAAGSTVYTLTSTAFISDKFDFRDSAAATYIKINQNSRALEVLNGPLHVGSNMITGNLGSSNGAPGIQTRTGNNSISFDWVGSTFSMYVGGSQVFSGTSGKTFVIDHPDLSGYYLRHAAIEGPANDVFYRGSNDIGAGLICFVELPEYFKSLTKSGTDTIYLTARKRGWDYPKNLRAGDIINGGFFVEADTHGHFDWEVKAERNDIPSLEVESKKSDYIRRGSGPYTWLEKV